MHKINSENSNAKTRELSWFGPCDLHPVPKQTAWDFPFLICVHPQPIPCTPLDKRPLPNVHNSSLHQENKHLVQLSSTPRRRPCTMIFFEWLQWSYKPWDWMYLWTRFLIGRISGIFTMDFGIWWRKLKEKLVFRKQNIWTEFWLKTLDF